jgi:protein-histidine pros-kinase
MTDDRVEICLGTAHVEQLFPFHFLIDRQCRIIQHGSAIGQLVPNVQLGDLASQYFQLIRPPVSFDYAELEGAAPEFLVVALADSDLKLRGQTLKVPGGLMLLVAPWVTDPEDLKRNNLRLSDFALHDSGVDYLTLLEVKNSALSDASRLSGELRTTNAQLSDTLAESERVSSRLETLLRNLPLGVVVEREDGKVVLANQEFCDIFRLEVGPDDLCGLDGSALAGEAKALFGDPEGFVREIAERVASRAPVVGQILELHDGRVLERDYVPVAKAGVYRGHLWQYRDITEKRRVERELGEARARAEQANAAKDAFLAMISHEMRTPMGAILGLSELLEPGMPEAEHADFLRRIRSNAHALVGIIEDLLDLSKLEAGGVRFEAQPFRPVELVEDVAESLAERAFSKGLELILDVDPAIVPVVCGVPSRLRQVLVNLLGNAIKFTDRGEVYLRVELLKVGTEGASVRYSVGDTGCGIPSDMREQIFDRFVRVEKAGTGSVKGTGLGLSICRLLLEGMGSEIELESKEGKGSVFSFELAHPVPDDVAAPEPKQDRPLHGRRVLLVEPLERVRAALVRMLDGLGAAVVEVSSVEQALRDASEGRFDTLIHDSRRGLALADQVMAELTRASDGSPPTRVILTAPQDQLGLAQREEALLIAKPVGLRNLAMAFAPADKQPRTDAADRAPTRSLTGHVLIVDDDPDNLLWLDRVLRREGLTVDVASDGKAGLRRLLERDYALLVTDVEMPVMDGLELATRVRALEASGGRPRLPIVAVSAHALLEHSDRAIEARIDEFLTKPVPSDALAQVLERLLDPTCPEGCHACDTDQAKPVSNDPLEAPLELRGLQAGLSKIDPDVADMIPGYLRNRHKDVRTLREALSGDVSIKLIRTVGHKIKGTGRAYGFDRISEIGAAMEEAAKAGRHEPISVLVDQLEQYVNEVQAEIERSALYVRN